jgi:hypothetical protein
MENVRLLVEEFADRLTGIAERSMLDQVRLSIESALGGRNGRRARATKALMLTNGSRRRRKGPIQLCPVPGCKNPAAPVFGMVCANHKDVPRKKIAKYRDARRAKKLKAAA